MPPVAFDVFRAAARAWLADAPVLDPPLAAAADVLATAVSARHVLDLAHDANDAHAALGASAVLDLWLGVDPR
jgi:hypothetical protein